MQLVRISLGLAAFLAISTMPATVASSDTMCILFTYDGTGNRTSRTTTAMTPPTWGSATWGCFAWSVP